MKIDLRRLLDLRPGEIRRVGYMAALLFFLLAANNVIKVVRDSLFLSRFPITHLPYVYLSAALAAALVIAVYSRFTMRLALARVLLGTIAFSGFTVVLFWLLLMSFNAGWILYGYYMWSAIVGLILVAQFWTFANDLFTPRDGKRLFGVITAGGTLGGLTGGLVSSWAARFFIGANHLLWFIVVLLAGAFAVVCLATKERQHVFAPNALAAERSQDGEEVGTRSAARTIGQSHYLQTIGAIIFVSVIVSTLIDYQFKATAKMAYPSANGLAGFFGSYYAWLSVVTMLAQLWLTGKLLTSLGLGPSLLVLPLTLVAGLSSILAWPGLLSVTVTRVTEASLRTSINQSSVQILYLPISDAIKKRVKVFMDVTMERLGDGVAAILILSYGFFFAGSDAALLGYFAIALVALWIALILAARVGYVDALRKNLAYRDIHFAKARIDLTDKATVEAVLKLLDRTDEASALFGLDLAEKLTPKLKVSSLPRALLRHPSPEVRRRALMLFADAPDTNILPDVFDLAASDRPEIQAEAIRALASIKEATLAPAIRPFVASPETEVKGAAVEFMIRCGDRESRTEAVEALSRMLADGSAAGERGRVEAARLLGELEEPEFAGRLGRLIRHDPAPKVVRAAMTAAGRRREPDAIDAIVAKLGYSTTKAFAREALVDYGEMAVEGLATALFDSRVPHEVRLNIPRTLGKIHAQSAMNALIGGLLDEDRAIRFKVILALEEMSRHFDDLSVDRDVVESAILSDASLYCQRFSAFLALFGDARDSSGHGESLLYFALMDSLERVKERVMWLLALVYPAKDIRRSWAALNSNDPGRRANAVEFLDNLLAGNIKRSVFPLFSDAPPAQRFASFAEFRAGELNSPDSALTALLSQHDIWLVAAAILEIGLRGLGGFGERILKFSGSQHVVVREAAGMALERISIQ